MSFFLCEISIQMIFKKNTTSSLCSQRLLFFKLQLKKTISDCRKYRFCLGIFSLHFQICTVVKEQDMYTEPKLERVQLLLETYKDTPTNKNKKHVVKPNINKCHILRGINSFSLHYNFVLRVRQSYVHSLMRAHL